MALVNYVDKTGLRFFYKQIKKLINNSGMNVVDITSETAIPQMTKTGSIMYYVNTANTSIPVGDSCNQIPSDANEDEDIFILNSCFVGSDGAVSNAYVLFDSTTIFSGRITTTSGDNAATTIGEWSQSADEAGSLIQEISSDDYEALGENLDPDIVYFVTDEDGSVGKIIKNGIAYGGAVDITSFAKEITQEEYDALSEEEQNNGTIYFITDGSSGALGGTITVEISQAGYDALSDEEKLNGKMYLIKDTETVVLHAPDIISDMTPMGETTLENLPETGETGDYWYLTDVLEGRYYDGSSWKIVR